MVAAETERVFRELTEELKEMDRNSRRSRGKNAVQQLLLLYPMKSLAARLARFLYLVSLPIAFFMTVIVVDVVLHDEDSSSLIVSMLTMLLVVLPFTLPTVVVRWLAVVLEQRRDRQQSEMGISDESS
jgi:ABC-type bacteriocin/lantibiotic exporter with double-glycine peptidase domain